MTDFRSAMCDEADRALVGSAVEPDPIGAARIYSQLAEQGWATAHVRLAVLAATGLVAAADWNLALDHLERAAELDDSRALGQLAALAGRQGNARDLRRALHLGALFSPVSVQEVSASPSLLELKGLATPAMCGWVMERGRNRLSPSMIVDRATGQPVRDQIRTGRSATFPLLDTDLVMIAIQERLARTTRLVWRQQEVPFLLSYEPGERYQPHFDFLNPDEPAYAWELGVMGQRVASCLVYLNQDYEGGETDFPRIGLRYRGRSGDALLFLNVLPDRRPDVRTLHAGLAPTLGRKWLLSLWVRDRELPLQ